MSVLQKGSKYSRERVYSIINETLAVGRREFIRPVNGFFDMVIHAAIWGIDNDQVPLRKDIDYSSEWMDWSEIESQARDEITPAYYNVYLSGAGAATKVATFEPGVRVPFPEAVNWAKESAAERVGSISNELKAKLRTAISGGIERGIGAAELAREIRQGLPLHPTQLARMHRWRREGRFATYADYQKEFTQQRRYRAQMIARTETVRSLAEGTLEQYSQAEVTRVEFLASFGACEECLGLHGNVYSVEEASGIIPVHSHCRCTWTPKVVAGITFE